MNKIALLNDAFRTTFAGGTVTMTAGVYALPDLVKAAALQKAARFDGVPACNIDSSIFHHAQKRIAAARVLD